MMLFTLNIFAVLLCAAYSSSGDGECSVKKLANDHQTSIYYLTMMLEANQVPSSKQPRYIEMLTVLMDENGDSMISSFELHDWMLTAHERLNLQGCLDKFTEADSDDDGLLDWDEFSTLRTKNVDLTKHSWTTTKEQIVGQEMDFFLCADETGDMKLSPREFHAVVYPLEHSHMDDITSRRLSAYDANDDGFIELMELRMLLDEMADDKSRKIYEEKFRKSDTDSDGILNPNEMYTWLLMTGQIEFSDDTFIEIFSESNIRMLYDESKDKFNPSDYQVLWKNPTPEALPNLKNMDIRSKEILRKKIEKLEKMYNKRAKQDL